MIEIAGVTKRFGSFTAIEDISLKVEPFSIYGLVGYNGAGKTTLLKTAAGIYRPEAGRVLLDGEVVYDNAQRKKRLFYIPDDLYFQPYANLTKMAKFYRDYYPDFSAATFEKLTKVFGLDNRARIHGFSKGMQRQAELVLALSTRPKFLLLDESFDGLDPQKRDLTKNLLLEYMAETGCCVLISSHNLHELSNMCDHAGLINGHKLVMNAGIDEISASRCKFRVALDHPVKKQEFSTLQPHRFQADGKVATFITSLPREQAQTRINALHPLLCDVYPLSLEEVFLEEMEGTQYDITQIFTEEA